jgi:hypothetical protein
MPIYTRAPEDETSLCLSDSTSPPTFVRPKSSYLPHLPQLPQYNEMSLCTLFSTCLHPVVMQAAHLLCDHIECLHSLSIVNLISSSPDLFRTGLNSLDVDLDL